MLAAYVATLDHEDPLANLEVGQLPEPELRQGWALVRVMNASLNHHDLFTLRGISSQNVHPPQILGNDAAGVVEAYNGPVDADDPHVGSRVVCFNPIVCGQCVFCKAGEYEFCLRAAILSEGEFAGTLAEYVQVPRENLVALPENVSFEDAACLPTAYLTAYRMLFHRAHAKAGDFVLVQGASGGVSTAAVLIGKAAGLNIAVTSRTQAKLDLAKDLGADAGILLNDDAAKAVRDWSQGRGVDVVLETVGEPTWDLSLRAARPGGTVVVAGGTGGYNPPAQLNRIFWRQLTIVGCVMGTIGELETLVDQIAAGSWKPLIGQRFALADAKSGFAEMVQGRTSGKIVISVG